MFTPSRLPLATSQALEKAKAAGVHERELTRKKEAQLGPEQVNLDLTFAVSVFGLG